MTAAERPQLRSGLRFTRHEHDGAVSYVVKNPASLKYFRFGTVEVWLMQRMDGSRSLAQLCDELRAETGLAATPQALDVLVRRLREMGLVERSLEERSALMMERLRSQRRRRRESTNSVVRLRFSFGDPDPLLGTMVTRMPFFWTRGFVAASIGVFALYALIVGANWDAFVTNIAALYSPAHMTLGIIAICYGSFVVTAIIHEFGHGLTCKRYGGEVHELGAMMLYFMPAFYCNVSDAWTFEKRAHRLWVTVAGGWIQLWVAALAAVVWITSEPGTLVHAIALYTAVLSGGFSVLLNYNPLIPLDGYYALVDWLNLPNLRARSFAYTGAFAKRWLLRLDSQLPAVTDRERRIFLAYGILSIGYTSMILGSVALVVGRFFGARLGGWGWLLFALLLFAMTKRLRAGLVRVARLVVTEKLPHGRRARIAGAALLALFVLAGAAAITPWTVHARGVAWVEPARRLWLRPEQPARLIDVRVADGAAVRAGDTIAVLRDPELELARAHVLAGLDELAVQAASARRGGDVAAARIAELAAEREAERLARIDQRRDALLLRAPFDGVVATPLLHERLGETVAAGDSLVELWRIGAVYARAVVPTPGAGELAVGAALRIRFPAHPALTWRTRVDRIEAAASEEGLVVLAPLGGHPDHELLPGMTGRARVAIVRTSVAGALIRSARRMVRGDLLL